MDIKDQVTIVTGGANGIGAAICQTFHKAGAKHVFVADLDFASAENVANSINGTPVLCDVSDEQQIQKLVAIAQEKFGRVDVFVSNAGITVKGGIETPDEDWLRLWNVNLMSNVYAARAVLPQMVERGSGYLVNVASAAGLLTEIGSAAYSVTKHGTVAFSEWLSVHYQKKGIKVSCVCPAGVATDFLNLDDPVHQFLNVTAVTPQQVADCLLDAMTHEHFLVLPHPDVGEYFAYKTQDYDKFLKSFARIHEKLERVAKKREKKSLESKD